MRDIFRAIQNRLVQTVSEGLKSQLPQASCRAIAKRTRKYYCLRHFDTEVTINKSIVELFTPYMCIKL